MRARSSGKEGGGVVTYDLSSSIRVICHGPNAGWRAAVLTERWQIGDMWRPAAQKASSSFVRTSVSAMPCRLA